MLLPNFCEHAVFPDESSQMKCGGWFPVRISFLNCRNLSIAMLLINKQEKTPPYIDLTSLGLGRFEHVVIGNLEAVNWLNESKFDVSDRNDL